MMSGSVRGALVLLVALVCAVATVGALAAVVPPSSADAAGTSNGDDRDMTAVAAAVAARNAAGAPACEECEGLPNWAGVYNATSVGATCNPISCCCPYDYAVVYQLGSMLLVSSPVRGDCLGLKYAAFIVTSGNVNVLTFGILGYDIIASLQPTGDVTLVSVDNPTCNGVVRRVASAEDGSAGTPAPAVAAATFPVLVGWFAFALALLSFLGLITVVLVRAMRGDK
jgi:hypothetical protein